MRCISVITEAGILDKVESYKHLFLAILKEKISRDGSGSEKDYLKENIAHLSLSVNMSCVWYLDSGCSRYMTEKEYLTDYMRAD